MGNPFDKLKALRDTLPVGDLPAQPAAQPAAPAPKRLPAPCCATSARAAAARRPPWSSSSASTPTPSTRGAARPANPSGCGGQVEGDALVLAGDQRARLSAWLTARGVKKVVGA